MLIFIHQNTRSREGERSEYLSNIVARKKDSSCDLCGDSHTKIINSLGLKITHKKAKYLLKNQKVFDLETVVPPAPTYGTTIVSKKNLHTTLDSSTNVLQCSVHFSPGKTGEYIPWTAYIPWTFYTLVHTTG